MFQKNSRKGLHKLAEEFFALWHGQFLERVQAAKKDYQIANVIQKKPAYIIQQDEISNVLKKKFRL